MKRNNGFELNIEMCLELKGDIVHNGKTLAEFSLQ